MLHFLLYHQTRHSKNSRALWRCTAAENFKFPTALASLSFHSCIKFILMVQLRPKYDTALILVIFNLGLIFWAFVIQMIDHYCLTIWRKLLTPIFPVTCYSLYVDISQSCASSLQLAQNAVVGLLTGSVLLSLQLLLV